VAATGKIVNVDLGIINGHTFAFAAALGPISSVITRPTPYLKRRAPALAYVWPTMRSALTRPVRVRIEVDDLPADEEFEAVHGILIGNFCQFATVLRNWPAANFRDGIMEIAVLRLSRHGAFTRPVARANDCGRVEWLQGSRIEVLCESAQPYQRDGQAGGCATEVSIEIARGALRLVVPETPKTALWRSVVDMLAD